MPLTPRPDWTLTPPDDSGAWEPYAYIIGAEDGVDLYWSRTCGGTVNPYDAPQQEIGWPFGADDIASRADFEALGFTVES